MLGKVFENPLGCVSSLSPLRKGIIINCIESGRATCETAADTARGNSRCCPTIVGKLASFSETDDQQEVGSACERQDGKRVVRGSNALALR